MHQVVFHGLKLSADGAGKIHHQVTSFRVIVPRVARQLHRYNMLHKSVS